MVHLEKKESDSSKPANGTIILKAKIFITSTKTGGEMFNITLFIHIITINYTHTDTCFKFNIILQNI